MKERIAEYWDRLDVWFRQHLDTAGNILKLGAVVLACGLLAVFIQQCIVPAPYVPPAPITQAAPITHIPTRTLTATWTSTSTASRTVTAQRPTNSPTPTNTTGPTSTETSTITHTPTMTRIPAGRDTLPKTGASAKDLTRIAETTPTITATSEAPAIPHCAYKWKVISYHWEAGEWVMTLRCPKEGGTPAAESVGD
jgi:hypothetical protein